jgi:hypothetical protein
MKKTTSLLLAAIAALPASAQSVDQPTIKEGDRWNYLVTQEQGPNNWSQTHNEVIVQRATASTIYFTAGQIGSKIPADEVFMGADWSRIRAVNGKEMVVNRPLAFPLSVGKTWNINYTEQHPEKHKRWEQREIKYTVLGYETLQLSAGTFKALKIEGEGHWTVELEPSQTVVQTALENDSTTTMVTQANKTKGELYTGRTYLVLWYVPEVKRFIKSVEESYDNHGVRNSREMVELESYKLSE